VFVFMVWLEVIILLVEHSKINTVGSNAAVFNAVNRVKCLELPF